MKKIALVIDDTKQVFEVESLQIGIDTHEGFDIVIVATTAEEKEVLQETPVSSSRPSGKGIEIASSFSDPQLLKMIPEALAKLEERRKHFETVVISTIDPTLHKPTPRNHLQLMTPYHAWDETDNEGVLVKVAGEIALEEKTHRFNNEVIFVESEPKFVFTTSGDKFRAEEKISVYSIIPPIQDAENIKEIVPEGESIVQVEEVDAETTELLDIFKELFQANENSVKLLIKGSDSELKEAYNFFIGQATLTTGNKIKREKIDTVLSNMITEVKKATEGTSSPFDYE